MTEHFAQILLKGAKNGNLAQVEEGWKKAENRYETDFLGHNALTLAIIHGHFDVFKFLVDEGANLDLINSVFSTFSTLCGTAKMQYLKEFKGSDGFLGATPLICAARERNFEMVQYLIEKGASPNIRDGEGHVALYYAILKRCDREMIEYLITSGSETEETRNQLNEYASHHQGFAVYWIELRIEFSNTLLSNQCHFINDINK